jgi:hypothetical protein
MAASSIGLFARTINKGGTAMAASAKNTAGKDLAWQQLGRLGKASESAQLSRIVGLASWNERG